MIDLNKILITGANGLIGQELDFGIKVSREEVDVTSPNSIDLAIRRHKPSAILNLASINMRDCQKSSDLATRVNIAGNANLADASAWEDIPLIVMSSGTVFNGDFGRDFYENDIPEPQNLYGKTKYFGEITAIKNNPKTLVIRTGWLFGFTKKRNFFNNMLQFAHEGKELTATYNQSGSFVYIDDFIADMRRIIYYGKPGIYHVANSGKATALELAEELVRYTGGKSKIREIPIEENERKDGIMRSRSEVLASNSYTLRNWKEALHEHLAKLKQ